MAFLSYKIRTRRLRDLRRERMLTQAELAAQAGVHISTVVRAESGENLGRVSLQAIAKALGVAPLELVQS